MGAIFPRSVTGLILTPGTPYRQRQIMARYHGADHAVPAVMSVLDIPERDAFVEIHRAHSPTTIVAQHLRVFEMSWRSDDSPEAVARVALDAIDGWKARTAAPCPRRCGRAQPLWAAGWSQRDVECVPCQSRTVVSCSVCGAPDSAAYMQPTRERLLRERLCFTCAHWLDAAAKPPEVVTGDWGIYGIGRSGVGPASARGFGGRRFTVRFFDGRTVTTDNLWSGGTIPERFRDRFTPNAEVIS